MNVEQTMVEQARLALAAHGRGDFAAYDMHRLNARAIAQGLDAMKQYAIAIGKQTYPRLCFSVYAPSQSEAGIRHDCLKAHADERMVVRRVRT